MPDMNENSETQQDYFGKTTGNDYRKKAIKQYFSIAKERSLFNDESLQNAFYEGFLDCAEFLLPLIEKMKCCENCHHWEDREPIPSSAEEGYFCYNDHNGICKRWELAKEDDYYRR